MSRKASPTARHPAPSTLRRCAIYTRKSSEEGLEQAFNSLHAQREACEAFIRSQRHEGWVLLPAAYDDGGISGGTLDRPALQLLLADLRAGKVDLVIVYKVDRLTRSLADFAKIVDVFDSQGASFVSVTQQFNTATSMGRLTLNMLLSFAQFEREVTGERIRDKIAASKRKGMWMGGAAPLGYDVANRKLEVNAAEAYTVRHIFTRYQALGSVNRLRVELAEAGIRSKLRPNAASPKMRGGQPLGRGAIYTMLQNRLYRGEVAHRDHVYPGEHEAILDAALWDAVQVRLAQNRIAETDKTRAQSPSLLAGLLFDVQGRRLTPTHAVKNGRRYRYYVSQDLQTGAANQTNAPMMRLPATDLEKAVCERLLSFLAVPTDVLREIAPALTDAENQYACLTHAAEIARLWPGHTAHERRKLLAEVLDRITVAPDVMELQITLPTLLRLLGREQDDASMPQTPISLPVAMNLKRAGMEMRLVVEGSADLRAADPTLIRLLLRARTLHDTMVRTQGSLVELAAGEGVTSSYIVRVLRLAYLAPDIVAMILNGRQPIEMTAEKLVRDSRLPLRWEEQRHHLGFA